MEKVDGINSNKQITITITKMAALVQATSHLDSGLALLQESSGAETRPDAVKRLIAEIVERAAKLKGPQVHQLRETASSLRN